MKIIEPLQPNLTTLTASSLDESTLPVWDSGTAYSVGDEVRIFSDGAYRTYEALIASTGEDPTTDPVALEGDPSAGQPYWLATGSTNRWAMFDGSVGSPSADTTDIVVTYTPGTAINALALFNVVGGTVNVTVASALAGGEIYNQTQKTLGDRGPGYWDFYFGGVSVRTRFQFFGIPFYPDMMITVTVAKAGGAEMAAIGELVFGKEFVIGEDVLGMEPRIKDYSTNEFNATFGYNVLVVRQTRRRLSITTMIDENRADTVFDKIQSLASQKVVWIADKYASGIIYGFYSDFIPAHNTYKVVQAQFKIEGLV
nr:hypothetical protein [uncultured Halomonas sp.]